MADLTPEHELPAGDELLDLPPPHHRKSWSWLFSFVIALALSFATSSIMMSADVSLVMASIVGIAVFVLTLFTVHAVAEKAR